MRGTRRGLQSKKAIVLTHPVLTDFAEGTALGIVSKRPFASSSPLGAMCVSSILMQCGWDTSLVDLNREYLTHFESYDCAEQFCDSVALKLAAHGECLYGFSTICSSYYVTLLVAERLRRHVPHATIVLGGPQASFTATETLHACQYVDYILTGEVEASLPQFLESGGDDLGSIRGLVYRASDGRINANPWPDPPPPSDMAAPAYDLWEPPPGARLNIEAGRGCPFQCRFCSTNSYFGRRYRLKPPEELISEIVALRTRFGERNVSFVHDNMFVKKQYLHDFCSAWTAEKRLVSARWSCSIRVNVLDAESVDLLSRSNCDGVFIGIETGSARMQRVIGKNLELTQARAAVRHLRDAKFRTTVAFIVGFPEETTDDFAQTLDFYSSVLAASSMKPQVALLSPVAGSAYHADNCAELIFDATFSSIAHQGSMMTSRYEEFIRSCPALFAAHYSIPLRHMNKEQVVVAVLLLTYAKATLRWLLVALARCTSGLSHIVDLWRCYKAHDLHEAIDRRYYSSLKFQEDFISFCRQTASDKSFDTTCCAPFLQLVQACEVTEDDLADLRRSGEVACQSLDSDNVVRRACIMREMDWSFRDLLFALEAGRPLGSALKNPSSVAIGLGTNGIVVEELSPLAEAILKTVDSDVRVSELIQKLARDHLRLLPVSVSDQHAGFKFAVESLRNRGMLETI